MAIREIPCPICKQPVSSGDPEFPFCSDRCRLQDLANWADDKYVIYGSRRPETERITSPDLEEEAEGPDL